MAREKKCPDCGATVPDTVPSSLRPFCSKRCKMNDLSRWLGGEYRISTPTGAAPTGQDHEENTE